MRLLTVVLVLAATALDVSAGGIVVQKIQGEVSVRHGVTEEWQSVSVGDVLRPDVTMKTGKRGSAVLAVSTSTDTKMSRRIALPEEVIVELVDIRDLTPEELMLKLTMQKVRSSSYEWKNKELNIPHTTAVHGTDAAEAQGLATADLETGVLQLNGTRVLFENGFYSTCALRAMEVFRRFPALGSRFEHRVMVAESLEKANLRSEALNEYASLAEADLDAAQRATVAARIERLRKELGR